MEKIKKANILIIGAGAYGSALKNCILSNKNNSVTLLDRKGCQLFTADITSYEFVLLAVPSQALRECALWLKEQFEKNTSTKKKLNIISTAKGIEKKTILLPHQILNEVFKPYEKQVFIAALSGPSFAKEMTQGLPTCVVLASKHKALLQLASPILHSPYFRVYDSSDILGVELGGALKNIVAMVAGAVDGLNLGNNARAAVITRGLSEMAEIGVKMGASPLTFMGLSGAGDLILTSTGSLSRNKQFGYRMAIGEDKNSILKSLGGVVEGIATTESAYELISKLNIKANILTIAFFVLYENLPISEALNILLDGKQSSELNWTNSNNENAFK